MFVFVGEKYLCFKKRKGSMSKHEMVMNIDEDSSDLIESFERELKGTDFEKEFLSLNKTLSDKDNDKDNVESKNKRSHKKSTQSVVLHSEENDQVLSKKA